MNAMNDATTPVDTVAVEVAVNGTRYRRTVPARMLLSDFIRDELGLTGTHLGCEHGICGACTVIADGQAVRSCLTLAAQADGVAITTVEGLASDETLAPIQACFAKHFALQCGFCTAGFLMTATAESRPNMTEEEVRELLSGNICRCTGYQPIVDAVLEFVDSQHAESVPK